MWDLSGDLERLFVESHVERKIEVGKQTETLQVIWLPKSCPNAPEDGMLTEAVEIFAEVLVVDVKVAHQPQDEGFIVGKVQNPLIIFHPLATFNDKHAVNANWTGLLNATLGESGQVDDFIIWVRPRRAARTMGS